MDNKRELYLTNYWNRYPVAHPMGFCGQVFIDDDQIFLSNQVPKKSEVLSYSFKDLRLPEDSEFSVKEVLREGDWVCIHENVLIILAPRLSELPRRQPLGEFLHWMQFKKHVTGFFESQGLVEVQTPTLVVCPGTEPFLDPFETKIHIGSKKQKRYLPTSPELHLKKLISQGMGDLFEIRSCFRDSEVSARHQPEFTMLEWYRPFCGLDKIQIDILELLKSLGVLIDSKALNYLSMADLFLKYLNFELTPKTTAGDLKPLVVKFGLPVPEDSNFDDLFGILFVDQIEPKLKEYKYLFLSGYPPSQAALARLTHEGWGDRFEFYIEGVEIANAFHELNDPNIQNERIEEDLHYRKLLKKSELDKDQDFIDHLRAGMPPTSGVALGLDRLYMVLNRKNDLREFRLFTESID